MEPGFSLLRTIHRLLRQQTDMEARLRRGPLKIKIASDNQSKFLEAKEQAQEAVTQTRMAADAKQLQLAEREAKIETRKGLLNACSSNKEFQLLKDQIAADTQANSVLQDEILELLERIDTLTENLEQANENHEKAQLETDRITQEVKQELQQLRSEIEDVRLELSDAVAKLPPDLLVEYERLVAGLGEDALGETDTRTCGNCNQQLTTQTAAELMMGKVVNCKGCGCLLYLSENHPANQP